jgi:hypothetical protein
MIFWQNTMQVKEFYNACKIKLNTIHTTATFGACNTYDVVCILFPWKHFTEDHEK